MTNEEVIACIAENDILKDIIRNIGFTENKTNLQDLEQDIYLELLERDDDLLPNLYKANQLKYYLSRIVINNIRSKNSRYFYRYKKGENLKEELAE